MNPRSLFSLIAIPVALITARALAGCGTDPASLTPSLHFQDAGGCGNVYAYKKNAAGTEYLIVAAEKDSLGLGVAPRTFDLATSPRGLHVTVDIYAYAPTSPIYCNDVLDGSDPRPATWKAVSGTVTITLSRDSATFNDPYTATVKMQNVVFESPGGDRRVTLQEETMKDITVGWLPG